MEQESQFSAYKQTSDLPNSTAVLVLGICSIVLCCCYGVPGLVCGIIALVLGSKGKKLYRENPIDYTESSYKNLNAGYICGIIGTVLSFLYSIYSIVIIIMFINDPHFMEKIMKPGGGMF